MTKRIERLDARRLYCEERKSIGEIAAQLHVPDKTIYNWKAGDKLAGEDWDHTREEMYLTAFSAHKGTLKLAMDTLNKISREGKIDPSQIYAVRQLVLTVKSLYKDVDTYGNILRTVSELIQFMQDRYPDLLQQMQPCLAEFGKTMQDKYGSK